MSGRLEGGCGRGRGNGKEKGYEEWSKIKWRRGDVVINEGEVVVFSLLDLKVTINFNFVRHYFLNT